MTAYDLARGWGSLTEEDVKLIKDLCADIPLRPWHVPTVIDIGAGIGNTALAVLEMGLQVETIDRDPHFIQQAQEHIPQEYWYRWTRTIADSVEASGHFDNDSLPLVLLDTTHYYEQTKRELESWLPKLKADGVLWCHDYADPHSKGFGVDKAVGEVVNLGRACFVAIAGLGCAIRRLD